MPAAKTLATPVIRYGSGPTRVGPTFVALSERGLCTLKLLVHEDFRSALAGLRRLFPTALLREEPKAAAGVLRQVDEVLAGERPATDIPLDLQGTPFQKHVWRVMQQIPRGKTCSYSDLAKRAGRPKAVRAVGSACARNPVALLVPCHRVLHRGGGLGGYGGGLDCKRELLRIEQD
jgi:AraC family transcriptional regulator, regulatory protein of adaptative response / methylated-DNA-[protein]-cysteine methyltransferase